MQMRYCITRRKMLIEISEIFKITKEDYNRIKGIYENKKSSDQINLKKFYELLGVSETDSLESIKKNIEILLKNIILIEFKEKVSR